MCLHRVRSAGLTITRRRIAARHSVSRSGSGQRRKDKISMRFAFYGLVIAGLVFLISGGHVLFLPLFFLLPLGGLFGHRRRSRRF